MKIEKVNENQIRCTLTREDLASRELKISELAYGTEKAKSLFRDMMQQANFEFGFEAEDIPLMIEAIPLNADCIVLIITKVEDPDELDTRFSRFAPSVTEESDEDSDESTADEVLDLFRRIQSEDNTASAPEAPSASAPEESDSVRSRLFRMESLKQVINAAVIAGSHYHGLSTLYHEEGTDGYYLILTQGEEDREVFDRVCNVISEYGIPKRSTPASLTFLEEHCSTLIAEHALQRLSNTSVYQQIVTFRRVPTLWGLSYFYGCFIPVSPLPARVCRKEAGKRVT